MNELLASASPLHLLWFMLAFGLGPRILTRVQCACFPPDDPRRLELRGEIAHVPFWKQPLWVAANFDEALCEGLPARWSIWRERRAIARSIHFEVDPEMAPEVYEVEATVDENGRSTYRGVVFDGDGHAEVILSDGDWPDHRTSSRHIRLIKRWRTRRDYDPRHDGLGC